MTSWIMELWMRNHDQSEWPELSIRQSDDACHVTDAKDHPPKEDIEKMCSEGFFLKHYYKYVDPSKLNAEEEDYHASCSSGGSLDEYEIWDSSSGYHEPYSGRSLKRSGVSLASSEELTGYLYSSEKNDGKTGKSNVSEPHLPHLPNANIDLQTPLKSNNEASETVIDEIVEEDYDELSNESDYLEPVETKGDDVNGNKHHLCDEIKTETLFYSSSDVSKCSTSLPTKQHPRIYSTISHPLTKGTNAALSLSNTKPSCHSYSGEIEDEYEEPSNIPRHSFPKKRQCGNDKGTKHPCNDATSEALFYISTGISGCAMPHVITKEQSNNSTPNFRTRNEKRNEAQLVSNEKPSCSSPTERTEKENDEESMHMPKRLLPVQRNGTGSNDTTSRDVGECQISQDTKRHAFSEVTNETLQYSSADVVRCKRPRNDIHQASLSFRTEKEDPYLQLNQEKSSFVEYQTLDFSRDRHSLLPEDMAHLIEYQNSLEHKLDEDDSSLYDDVIGCISEDSTHLEQFVRGKTCRNEYQNMAYQSDDDETSSEYDDVIGFIIDDSTRFEQFSNGDGGVAEYQNMAQKLGGNDCASYNKSLAITKDNTDSGGYQHTASKLNQNDSAVYDKPRHGKDDSKPLGKFQSKTRGLRGDRSMYKTPRCKTEDEAGSRNHVLPLNENDTTHNFDLQSRDAESFTCQNLEYMQIIPFRISHKEGQTSTTQGTQAKTKKESHPRNKESVGKVSALHHIEQRDEYEAEYERMTRNHVVSLNANDTTLNFNLQGSHAEPCTYKNLEYLQTIPVSTSYTEGQTSTAPATQAKRKKESYPRNKECVSKVSALHHVKQRDENVYANRHTNNGTRHSSIGGALRRTKDGTRHSSIGGAKYSLREGIRLEHEATLTAAKHDTRLQQRHHSTFSRTQLDDPNLNVIFF